MQVTIDSLSGFCFGVKHAVEVAERELRQSPVLYCLGDIVHNKMEVSRLREMGLVIITHEDLRLLYDCKVLIRAHGEPPETYRIAFRNQIELIDASCPIVLALQNSIRKGFTEMSPVGGQTVIYGKEGHAEVNALIGQTIGTAIVIENEDDLAKIDYSLPVRLYSQTTKSVDGFRRIVELIRMRMKVDSNGLPVDFKWNDSICRQVSNRSEQLRLFASQFDTVIFVSDMKSSNGMILYEVCKSVNSATILVSGLADLKPAWFENVNSTGICGATSTPMWLMEEIAEGIRKIND